MEDFIKIRDILDKKTNNLTNDDLEEVRNQLGEDAKNMSSDELADMFNKIKHVLYKLDNEVNKTSELSTDEQDIFNKIKHIYPPEEEWTPIPAPLSKEEGQKVRRFMDIAKHNLAGLADGTIDPLDCIGLVEMVDIDLYSGVRGAKIISEDLLYLDEEKTKPRIKIATSHTFFSYADSDIAFYVNHDAKSNVVLYMKEGEKLSDILTQLPHGLIDKKITGIGATTLEIKSPRNSIIVVPTRRLAMQKVDKENKEQGKEVCLYVGSKDNADSTSPTDINTYLDKDEIEYKKIVVVADSLGKVIQTIQKRDVDVYRDYFFMVDEIDTLQSDGHFRDNLENVIDYYLKFKIQKRCLVSATVKGFNNPDLKKEKEQCLSTIIYETGLPKRDIQILHTNNVFEAVNQEITKRLSSNPDDKILIAYNTVTGIKIIISLLEDEIQEKCGILCGQQSKNDAGEYYTEITSEDTLEHQVTFMTCAYFSGIDIANKCHLITISDVQIPYSVLPINRITQIHGRCRNGILSDTMIHNSEKKEIGFKDITEYREHLFKKADKVIALLKAAKNLKEGDKYLEDLFAKIEDAILEKANETLFSNAIFKLIRRNVFDYSIFHTAYFNIDALCEKMIAYTTLYHDKKGLYNELIKHHHVKFEDRYLEITKKQKEKSVEIEDNKQQKLIEKLNKAKEELLTASKFSQLDRLLDKNIKNSKREEKDFYLSVQKFYPYIDLEPLMDKLIEVGFHKKSYKNLNNAMAFWVLDDGHFFKANIIKTFQVNNRYSPETIHKEMKTIFNHHLLKPLETQSKAVEFLNCCFNTERPKTEYLIIGTNPKGLPKPKQTIKNDDKVKLNKMFIFN